MLIQAECLRTNAKFIMTFFLKFKFVRSKCVYINTQNNLGYLQIVTVCNLFLYITLFNEILFGKYVLSELHSIYDEIRRYLGVGGSLYTLLPQFHTINIISLEKLLKCRQEYWLGVTLCVQ